MRAYCLDKPGAIDENPFGPGALVMKVGGKIFAIIAENEEPLSISLKCDPDEVALLRESFEDVAPGYHLNKKHWNTVTLTGSIPYKLVQGWIDDSYDLVFEGLSRRLREEIAEG